jgi:hypothetical protein
LTALLCSSCKSYVYVNSPWPRIYRTKNVHKKISLKMSDLDALGAENKKKLIVDITNMATYIAALEASLDAYAVAREKHNTKFKEDTVGKKETSP